LKKIKEEIDLLFETFPEAIRIDLYKLDRTKE